MADQAILSVVVVVYDMEREAPRTLYTLTPEYQGLSPSLYEVIVVDNGSRRPLGEECVRGIGKHFQYRYIQPGNPSPVKALNLGASLSRGQLVGFLIDGARLLSPGILQYAIRAARAYDKPVVSTMGYHLGNEPQPIAAGKGYDQAAEDQLLGSVDWRGDGYELFRVSSPSLSSGDGWFAPMTESNCVFVRPETFGAVGGFHPGFETPGGGIANLDFYRQVCEQPGTELVVLLGEGTFHQFHDGAMTGRTIEEVARLGAQLLEEYERVRGRRFSPPAVRADFLGHVPPTMQRELGESLHLYSRFRRQKPEVARAFEASPRPPNRFAGEPQANRPVIILGMHRSGTSALAGSLQEAGLNLGNVVQVAPYNEKGNREKWAILHMQEDLLARNGGSWKDVPATVRWFDLHRAVRDEVIEGFRGSGVWGFKDPRTLFTLDGWLEVLPHAELVGIFRHPLPVAESLQRRDGLSFEQGLALWGRYNEKLLALHRSRPFPLIEFHDDPAAFQERLRRVCEALQLPGRFRAFRFFEDALRHQRGADTPEPRDATKVYDELRSRESFVLPAGPA